MEGKKTQETRHVGIDLGKRTYEVAIVGNRGKATLSNGKTTANGAFKAGKEDVEVIAQLALSA